MLTNTLKLGGIYTVKWPFSERLSTVRIIGLDNIQVFYDAIAYDNTWTLSGAWKKTITFYRVPASIFTKCASLIEESPLTDDEKRFFTPELPIRIGCIKNLDWLDLYQLDFDTFSAVIKENSDIDVYNQQLMVDKVILQPHGNKGGQGKSSILTASNSNSIGCIELLWNACQLRKAINTQKSNGIGIHRTGFSKGLPSYYIDDYYDKANIMEGAEK